MYDHLHPSSVVQSSHREIVLITCLFVSFAAFGNPSQLLLFFISVSEWFPGLITWIFDHSSSPGVQNLRENQDRGRAVAQKLLESKRQELRDGVVRKDVMSLLGLLFPFFYSRSRGR